MRINFQELSEMNPKELAQFRSQTVGFVFQKFNLIPNLSALENVSIAMESTKMNRQDRRSRAAELLKEVGLDKRMSHLPGQLSGGEQQRVSIAELAITRRLSMQTNHRSSISIIQLFDKIRKDFDTSSLSHTILQ